MAPCFSVAVGAAVNTGVCDRVRVGVAVAVGVGVAVAVDVGVGLPVAVGVPVIVGVPVGCGVGVGGGTLLVSTLILPSPALAVMTSSRPSPSMSCTANPTG